MEPLTLGAIIALATVLVLFSGVSVAVGLLIVSAGFLLVFDGFNWPLAAARPWLDFELPVDGRISGRLAAGPGPAGAARQRRQGADRPVRTHC